MLKLALLCIAVLGAAAAAAAAAAATSAEAGHTRNALLLSDTEGLVVPMDVTVVFLGLDGSGARQYSRSFANFPGILGSLLGEHVSHIQDTGESLLVHTQPRYRVKELGGSALKAVERSIGGALKHVGMDTFEAGAKSGGHRRLGVPIPRFAVGMDLVLPALKAALLRAKVGDAYTVVFMNPSRERILAAASEDVNSVVDMVEGLGVEDRFSYAYTAPGRADGCTQVFLSNARFIVVDLSAGPCQWGDSDVSEGTVSLDSVPRITASLVAPRRVLVDGREVSQGGESSDTSAGLPAARERRRASVRLVRQQAQRDLLADRFPTEADAVADALFEARLASIAVRAVQLVFAPDVAHRHDADSPEKILVAVMVFRDHDAFNPLVRGHTHSIDMDAVTKAAKQLALPGQDIVVATGLHSLHDHRHVAAAVARSVEYARTHEVAENGRFELRTRAYYDSVALVREIRRAADVLASGLLAAEDSRVFYAYSRARHRRDAGKSDSDNDDEEEDAVEEEREEEEEEEETLPFDDAGALGRMRGTGTTVLPVYVFSLLHTGPDRVDALVDRRALAAASRDFVLVMQSNASSIAAPFHSGGAGRQTLKQLRLDARDPTAHIIVGLMQSLASTPPPTGRHSPAHGRVVKDYLFAQGVHPFAPYGTARALPTVYTDHALRNTVLSRASEAARLIRRAVRHTDTFAERYLYDSFGGNVSHASPSRSWIEVLHHGAGAWAPGGGALPLARETVQRLHAGALTFADKLQTLGESLYLFRKPAARRRAALLSTRLLHFARVYGEYAETELRAARRRLACCELRTVGAASSGTGWWAVLLPSAVIAVLMVVSQRCRRF